MTPKTSVTLAALAIALALAGCVAEEPQPAEDGNGDFLGFDGEPQEAALDANGTATARYEVEDWEDRTNLTLHVNATPTGDANATVEVRILDDEGNVLANETLTVSEATETTLSVDGLQEETELVVEVEAVTGAANVRLSLADDEAELDPDTISVEA